MSYTLFRDSFGFTFELTKHIHYSPLKIIIFGLFYEGRSRSDNKTLKIAEFSKKCLQSRLSISLFILYRHHISKFGVGVHEQVINFKEGKNNPLCPSKKF